MTVEFIDFSQDEAWLGQRQLHKMACGASEEPGETPV
jgi:hypothetical protein